MKQWKLSVVGGIALLIALPALGMGPDLPLFLLIYTLALIAGLLMAGKWLGK